MRMSRKQRELERRVRTSQFPLPDPRYWGPKFWFTMHTIAYFYPEQPTPEDMAHAKHFYESLQSLLPCPGCANHYARILKQRPIDKAVTSRMALIRWVNGVHNEVNRRLGKSVLSLDEYFARHERAAIARSVNASTVVRVAGVVTALATLAMLLGALSCCKHKGSARRHHRAPSASA